MRCFVRALLVSLAIVICAHMSQADDICAAASSGLLVEKETTAFFEQKAEFWRNTICGKDFETWNQVQQAGGTLSIGIPDVIDAKLGGNTNSGNYGERRHEFCHDESKSSQYEGAYFREVNKLSEKAPEIIRACKGFTAMIIPSANFRQFAIELNNNRDDNDRQITVRSLNLPNGVTCPGYTPGKVYDFHAVIGCNKPEAQTFQISGNTNRGPIGAVDVPGKDDAMAAIQQKISALAAESDNLRTDLQKVKSSLVFSRLFTLVEAGNVNKSVPSKPVTVNSTDGFCFITHIKGAFAGDGESAAVSPGNPWQMATGTANPDKNYTPEIGAYCLKFNPPFSNN